MSREVRRYIDKDVYEMAKERISHILDIFDTVAVCFSGGKDSLAVLNLVEEVYAERGISQKVKVVFRDEELIPDDVISFVDEKYRSGKYDFYYFAIPLKSQKFVLGECEEYVQWDAGRKWLRNPPEYAIRLEEGDARVFDQYTADSFICSRFKGKVALLTGIRADESLVRLNSCLRKRNENYINATEDKRVSLCKPIYDWRERDVFVYFFRHGIRYCRIYDLQTINNDRLRVSTPLHAESAKNISKLKTLYPVFYQQLMDLFPEMLVQSRYWGEYDNGGCGESFPYEHTLEGIRKYARDTISDNRMLEKALKFIDMSEVMRKNEIRRNPGNRFGGYPVLHVLKRLMNGSYKRVFLHPVGKCEVTRAMEDFESAD